MCKYYKHGDYYTVQKKEKLGDNDVENVFYHKEKNLLDQQNKLHTSQGRYRRVNYFDERGFD